MQETKQQKLPIVILKQQDISQVIKHFSFTIQQRFEEIQKNYNYFSCLNSINYQKSDLQKDILNKYSQYKTSDEHEIKLLERFVERVLQVFEFFRQKADEPEILQQMNEKISEKLRQIMKNETAYHFFVNNRPKTHSTTVKPLGNRSISNDFLSIVGPSCYKPEVDISAVFINSKARTQTPQKRVVQVGKLFKYVFSVLKRGYLVKLRMEKQEKKGRTFHKDVSLKNEENTTTISVEGTCAVLRNCSSKGNKENSEVQGGRVLSFGGREKLNVINPLSQLTQNKRQFQISQKIKNRSISTNQYSILSSHNNSTLKQPSSKIREIDKRVNALYEVLNIEKYSVVRVAKDPDMWRKDQVKRNAWVEHECRKYVGEYQKWSGRDKLVEVGQSADGDRQTLGEDETCSRSRRSYCQGEGQRSGDVDENIQRSLLPGQIVRDFILIESQPTTNSNCDDIVSLETSQQHIPSQKRLQKITYQEHISFKPTPINFKTQQNDHSQLSSVQNGREFSSNTIVVCSSRPYSKISDKVLTDKSSNLMDVNMIRNTNDFSSQKSKSNKQEQRKALRLNLPGMLGDKSNVLKESNIRKHNNATHHQHHQQKSFKASEKSQYYMQSYHMDVSDDGIFVPLLPKKEKNSQNIMQNRNDLSIKRKNIVPNFHPLNRCRLFREKKHHRNSIMVPMMDGRMEGGDCSGVNGRVKNAMF